MTTTTKSNQGLDYTRHYAKWHSDAPEHVQGVIKFYQDLFSSFLPKDKGIQILDVGCGMGFAMMSMQDMGYTEVEGIDIDCGQVQSCLSKQLQVTHVENSVEFLNKACNSYDLIFALDVIEHLPYEEQLDFCRSIYTALKPNGKLICTVPNANSVLASRWRYIDWTHHTSFTEHSLDFLLFNAGFSEIQVSESSSRTPPDFRQLFSRAVLAKPLWKDILHWWMFRMIRSLRRLEMVAELGWEEGRSIPLSLNLLSTAVKNL